MIQSWFAFGERWVRSIATRSRASCCSARARGDARPESDYDVAVFHNSFDSFNDEAVRLAAIETDILYDTGAIINAMPFHAGADRGNNGLMAALRRDGLELGCTTRWLISLRCGKT